MIPMYKYQAKCLLSTIVPMSRQVFLKGMVVTGFSCSLYLTWQSSQCDSIVARGITWYKAGHFLLWLDKMIPVIGSGIGTLFYYLPDKNNASHLNVI